MLKAFNAYIKPEAIKLNNLLKGKKQIIVHYYPSETKGRVYKADYFNGHEIFFNSLEEESCKPF